MLDNVPVAFNIGYGFGLVESKEGATHTENIVFYNGKAHKLDEITFHHEKRDPTKPWKFTSNDFLGLSLNNHHLLKFHDADGQKYFPDAIKKVKSFIKDAERLIFPSDNNEHVFNYIH